MSGRREKDFQLFTKVEQFASKPTLIQQQKPILQELQVLATLLSEPVVDISQVGENTFEHQELL